MTDRHNPHSVGLGSSRAGVGIASRTVAAAPSSHPAGRSVSANAASCAASDVEMRTGLEGAAVGGGGPRSLDQASVACCFGGDPALGVRPASATRLRRRAEKRRL